MKNSNDTIGNRNRDLPKTNRQHLQILLQIIILFSKLIHILEVVTGVSLDFGLL